MTIFLASLAGIPPLRGLVRQVRDVPRRSSTPAPAGRSRSAIIAAVNSVIAFFYYARVDPGDVVPRAGRPTTARRSSIPQPLDRRDRAHRRGRRGRRHLPADLRPGRRARVLTRLRGACRRERRRRAPRAGDPPRGPDHVRPVHGGRALRRRAASSRRGHGAGRAGRDFVTSPEVGPLFGACVARALDRLVARARASPIPFLVVEAGAGQRPARARGAARRARLPAGAALRARRTLGRAAGRAARAAPARAGRRGARPVRPRAPTTTSAGARAGGRPGRSPRSTSCPRSPARRRSCSPTSCSTTCRSGSRSGTATRWLEVRVGARRRRRVRRGARPGRRRPRRTSVAAAARACPIPRGLDEWWRDVRGRRCAAASSLVVDYATTIARARRRGRGCAPTARTRAAAIRSTPRASRTSPPTSCSSSSTRPRPFPRRARRPPGRLARARSASTSSSPRAPRSGRRARARRPRGARRPQPRHRGRRADRPRRPRRAPRRRSSRVGGAGATSPGDTVASAGVPSRSD